MSPKFTRVFAIVISGILTFVLLIGGTLLYQKYVYADPLEASVTKLPTVSSFKMEQSNSRSKVSVEFNVHEKLKGSFYLLLDQLEQQSARSLDNLTVEIVNQPDAALETFLQEARLPIYEAISTGHFTAIPDQLTKIAQPMQISYDLELDNHFVFLTANHQDRAAHLIISRGNSPLIIVNTMGGEYL